MSIGMKFMPAQNRVQEDHYDNFICVKLTENILKSRLMINSHFFSWTISRLEVKSVT